MASIRNPRPSRSFTRLAALFAESGLNPTFRPKLRSAAQAEVATVNLAAAGDEFTASAAISEVAPWIRVCLAATVSYTAEPTALTDALVREPEITFGRAID